MISSIASYGTEWPILCWCAIKQLLTHCIASCSTQVNLSLFHTAPPSSHCHLFSLCVVCCCYCVGWSENGEVCDPGLNCGIGSFIILTVVMTSCYIWCQVLWIHWLLLLLLQHGWPRSIDLSPEEPWNVQIRVGHGSDLQSVTVSLGTESIHRVSWDGSDVLDSTYVISCRFQLHRVSKQAPLCLHS